MRLIIVSGFWLLLMVEGHGLAEAGKGDAIDPVLVRVLGHVSAQDAPRVRVVGQDDLPAELWPRVRNLIGFRIHRHRPDGTTVVDSEIYLLRSSTLYLDAAAALRTGMTRREYLWCLLAAVIAHEAAHTAPLTEAHALRAEAAQLRRCLFAGHLHGDGWNATTYLGKVEAKLRNPREHY